MNAPPNLFTDGKAYERLMGRWSQLAGAKFLGWPSRRKDCTGSMSAAAMALSPKC